MWCQNQLQSMDPQIPFAHSSMNYQASEILVVFYVAGDLPLGPLTSVNWSKSPVSTLKWVEKSSPQSIASDHYAVLKSLARAIDFLFRKYLIVRNEQQIVLSWQDSCYSGTYPYPLSSK